MTASAPAVSPALLPPQHGHGHGGEEKEKERVFWPSQPVQPMARSAVHLPLEEHGPIEIKKLDDVDTEPVRLPPSYQWVVIDLTDDKQATAPHTRTRTPRYSFSLSASVSLVTERVLVCSYSCMNFMNY